MVLANCRSLPGASGFYRLEEKIFRERGIRAVKEATHANAENTEANVYVTWANAENTRANASVAWAIMCGSQAKACVAQANVFDT